MRDIKRETRAMRHAMLAERQGKVLFMLTSLPSPSLAAAYRQRVLCDGAVAGGRLELRPPVESSDLDEKVLPLHR
jgi:hypothetical protein